MLAKTLLLEYTSLLSEYESMVQSIRIPTKEDLESGGESNQIVKIVTKDQVEFETKLELAGWKVCSS